MKNINPPTLNQEKNFENIIEAKVNLRKIRLKTLKNKVFNSYIDYYNKRKKLENIKKSEFQFNQKGKDLSHCYDSDSIALSNLKASIKQGFKTIGGSHCPYCLLPSPYTFDHYLPKKLFPEFSILPINLIPCCFECNNKRLEDWLNKNARTTINPYFDAISKERFLFASISLQKNVPQVTFVIKNSGKISKYLFQIIKDHFEKLNLINRYKDQVNTEISEINKRFLNPTFKKLSSQIPKLLLDEADSKRSIYGINYWKAAVYEALARFTGKFPFKI